MPPEEAVVGPANMSEGEKLLFNAVSEAHGETSPNTVIDPTIIITIIGMILDFLKGCRNPASGTAHMARGSVIAHSHARKALRASNYQGDIGATARAVVRKGVEATDAQRAAVMAEASEVPQPPAPTGPWSLVVLAALCLFGGSAMAGEGPWPSLEADVADIKTTVHSVDSRLTGLEASIDRVKAILEGTSDAEPTPAPAKQKVAVASSGISFRGQPINVNDWLARYRNVPYVGINGDVDAHLRYHGFSGNFSGLSRSQKLVLHSAAHAGVSSTAMAVSRSAPSPVPAQAGCANGQCALQSAQRSLKRYGLFGRPIYK